MDQGWIRAGHIQGDVWGPFPGTALATGGRHRAPKWPKMAINADADLWTKMGPKMGSHKLYNGQIFETKSAHCSNIISKNVETSKHFWEVL